jgi:hypothetical protein
LKHHILGIPVAIMLCTMLIRKFFLSYQTSQVP